MRIQQIYIEDGVYEKVQSIWKQYHKDLSEVVNEYLERVVKKPEILEKEQKDDFIGILDNKIGNIDLKEIKRERYENFSWY